MNRLDESVDNEGSYKDETQLVMERVKEKIDNLKRDSHDSQKIFMQNAINLSTQIDDISEKGFCVCWMDREKIRACNNHFETLGVKFDSRQIQAQNTLNVLQKSNNNFSDIVAVTRQAGIDSMEFGLKLEKEFKNLTEILMSLPQQYSRDNLRLEVDNIRKDSQRLHDDVREVRDQLNALRSRLAEQVPSDTKDILESIDLTNNDITKNHSKIESIEKDIRQLQLKQQSLGCDHQCPQMSQNQ